MNAGKYRHKIAVLRVYRETDAAGFPVERRETVLEPYAEVKTTRGMTIIAANSNFEKALTRFTIRFPAVEIDRKMKIEFSGKIYDIEYLKNVDEAGVELEIQAREVTH